MATTIETHEQQTSPHAPSAEPQVVSFSRSIEREIKTDEITAIQESIDGLSLAMFEALRGLRDAVAPESGNLVADSTASQSNSDIAQNQQESGPDFEEFWQAYRNNDPDIVAAVRRVGAAPPQKREDYIRIFAKVEREKDAELVAKLADTVLRKSADIDERVSTLSGMNRTRTQQIERIEELLRENAESERELNLVSKVATDRRAKVRSKLQEQTCQALGIDEF